MKTFFTIFLFILWFCIPSLLQAQPSLEVFGQNRIQYRKFDWKFYEAKHFKIYHYDRAGRELARYVAEQAEKDLGAIQQKSGSLFSGKLSIILYNSFDDFDQSNIGLNSELQMQNNNPAGTVNIIGDKLVVYFTGSHSDLKRQLRQGMARVVMEHLMFGDNFKEIVRNAVLLDLPQWVTAGYVDFIVDRWTANDENEWKNLMLQSKKVHFNELAKTKPKLAGKAFWKYIATKYNESTVREILYTTQLRGSFNQAIKTTLNQKIKTTFDSLVIFYQDKYTREDLTYNQIDTGAAIIKIRIKNDESEIRNVLVSPRGNDLSFVKWQYGEYEVILEKTKLSRGKQEKEQTVLFSGGVKNFKEHSDPDYPLMAWSNTGFKLGILIKTGNHLRLRVYNSVKGKIQDFRIPERRFDRITGFTFTEDDEFIVLSAIKNGQSDIFEMRLRGGRLNQITNDAWDDKDPVFVSGGARKGIVFLSNRPQPYINIKPLPNELPTGMMNAYFYNSTTKSYDLLQLTHNEKGSISDIIPYGSDHFAYLSDKSGIINRYVVLFARNTKNQDSAYSVPVTNYPRNIKTQQYNPASGKVADMIQYKDMAYINFADVLIPEDKQTKELPPSTFVDGIRTTRQEASSPLKFMDDQEQVIETKEGEKIITPNNNLEIESGDYFQTEFSKHKRKDAVDSATVIPDEDAKSLANSLDLNQASPKDNNEVTPVLQVSSSTAEAQLPEKRILYVDSTFISLRSKPYRLSFRPDFFSIRLDNGVIFNRYQPYTNSGGQYFNPSLSGMLMLKLFDKMEDYRFTAGIQIPANFSGNTYFLQFENFRSRIDWGLIFLRNANNVTYNFLIDPSAPSISTPGKTLTNIIQGSVHYPLDKVKGIHLHMGFRQDRMIIKAQDFYGALLPSVQDVWTMSRIEFIKDNTRMPAMNIWNGTRYKIFGEYMYKLYTDNKDIYSLSENGENIQKGGFYNLGIDYRFYQPLYKNFIAAIRFAGAHSGGNQQILYYLGGKENALNPSSEIAMPPSGKNNYAFQGLAQNLRGYGQNARNGNTYALLNAELRLPVFTTFFNRPFQSPILNNLQAIAFADVGSAWEGLLPTDVNVNRSYNFTWPPNTNSPPVNVRIPSQIDKGLAIGYGAGLRTLLFGYFIGADVAWNIKRNINKKPQWYLSIGTDF